MQWAGPEWFPQFPWNPLLLINIPGVGEVRTRWIGRQDVVSIHPEEVDARRSN